VQKRLAELGVSMPTVDDEADFDDKYDTQEPNADAEQDYDDKRPLDESVTGTAELERIRSLAVTQ
jgi:hypothetical protein